MGNSLKAEQTKTLLLRLRLMFLPFLDSQSVKICFVGYFSLFGLDLIYKAVAGHE